MTIRVIGAGLGRTGTMSLKNALETLLGGPCYHMTELFNHLEEHTPIWHAAARGEDVDWDEVFGNYSAAVDEPASPFWRSIADFYPEALIVLSTRDAESWWKSASQTIFPVKLNPQPDMSPARKAWLEMILDVYKHIYPAGFDTADKAKAGYLEHVASVLKDAPNNRLLVWEASQGWEPLCKALDLAVPDEPFPHSNTAKEFKARRTKPV